MSTVDQIREILKSAELKVTHQRYVILKTLLDSASHPTTDWVFEAIRQDNPAISLATVYKTLETFVTANIVKKVKSEDGKIRFDANVDPHNHIYCKQSGRIFDFKDDQLDQLVQGYLQKSGLENFEMNDFQVVINGRVIDPTKPVSYKKLK